MELVSLEEFNKQVREQKKNNSLPIPNGIACPNCDEELWDTHPQAILACDPPKKRTHCINCEYTGYRRT